MRIEWVVVNASPLITLANPRGLITAVMPHVQALAAAGLWLSATAIRVILQAAGED